MRSGRDIIAIIVLLLVFIVGGLLLGGRDNTRSRQVGKEASPDSSVYNDRASGSEGAFQFVEKLGYKPVVLRQGWATLGRSGAATLLVIDPRDQSSLSLTGQSDNDATILSAADWLPLRNWLRTGHTAILLTSRMPSGTETGGDANFADRAGLIVESAASGHNRTEFAPLQPVRDTQGVLSIRCDSEARIRETAPRGLALFGDDAGPVVITRQIGKGRLTLIADSGFASNAALPRSENALFLANALARGAREGDSILFDEYHHGDEALGSDESLWAVLGRPLQLTLIQLLLAAIVVVGVVAVRFGTPIPLLRGLTRTSAEYVVSLASLYRRAEASSTALSVLYRQFLRDLSGRLALAPDVNLEQLAEVAARRGQTDKVALRRLLATCEQRLDEGKITETELLSLVRQMERVRKEIGIA